ncbi:acetylornithine deacetylase [Microbacterium sp. AG1240]|uniref:M20 family metallopeptidase n=1 Tax=Microbacterium sp. AG1240 TaxID=2183992 RepID=UPI000EAC0D10|nr:M20 family metallopeptidase [Microbacterium sp. AG1240]RKT31627.1 acetylornithine deacetylase [Microbacterium sp. AG1240]
MTNVTAAVDRYLDEHTDDLLALVTELVSIDSQIPPWGDERLVVARLDGILAEMGVLDRRIVEPVRHRPSLIARIPGAGGGRTLLLCGHVDTKPVGDAADQWRSDPFAATLIDGDLVGLGTTDMKGAVAAMLIAVRAVQASGVVLRGDVVLGLLADEEAGAGAGARLIAPLLADAGIDAALIGEPSGWTRDWQGIHLVSRGILGAMVTVGGTQKHSGLSDRLPTVNAALKAAELMLDAASSLSFPSARVGALEAAPTVTVGVTLSAGVSFGVTPGRATFGLEIRTVPGMTPRSVADGIESWLDGRRAADPELEVSYTLAPGLEWLPWSVVEDDSPVVLDFCGTEDAGAP